MEQPDNETIILKYIASHKGSLSVDIFNGLNKRGHPITINTIRKFLRKLVRNRKVVRTGVHAFRYTIRR